jgi:opacity protein-like surface antigen
MLLSAAGGAFSQTPDDGSEPSPEPELKRFSLSFYVGAAKGGPNGEIESAMRANGFDASTACWLFCSGTLAHPKSYAPEADGGMIVAKYRLRHRFAIQLVYGDNGTGQVIGAAGSWSTLIVDHGVTTVASIVSFEEGPLQLGLGPALYRVRVSDDPGGNRAVASTTRLGLLADAGVQLPWNSRFFVDLRAQYRLVGSTSFGPVETGLFDETSFPGMTVSFNHAYIAIGFGFRI